MKKYLKISTQIICLLLMVHLTALNMQFGTYLGLINSTNTSKDFDLEEELDAKSGNSESEKSEKNSKDIENDDLTKYLFSLEKNNFNNFLTICPKSQFCFKECTNLNVHFEINIPPPRA